jgi:hypothetical protein
LKESAVKDQHDYHRSINPFRQVPPPEDGLKDYVITRRSVIECQLYVRAANGSEALELARSEEIMEEGGRKGVFDSSAAEASLIRDTYRHSGSPADIGYTYK